MNGTLKNIIGFVDSPRLSRKTLHHLPKATPAHLNDLSNEEKALCVILVQDAFTSFFDAEVVLDIFEFLQRLGFHPLVAPFKANGKPLHVHGFLHEFTKVAEANASMLKSLASSGVALVGIDPSMTLTYRSEYLKYTAEGLTPEVHLLQDWLLQVLNKVEAPKVQAQQFRLLAHCTESTNATGSIQNWQKVFKHLGHKLDIVKLGCCGMSGTFGHEARNKLTSQKLYRMSWQTPIEEEQDSSRLLVTGFSCRSQVKREGAKQLLHPIQALLKALL